VQDWVASGQQVTNNDPTRVREPVSQPA